MNQLLLRLLLFINSQITIVPREVCEDEIEDEEPEKTRGFFRYYSQLQNEGIFREKIPMINFDCEIMRNE